MEQVAMKMAMSVVEVTGQVIMRMGMVEQEITEMVQQVVMVMEV